MQTRREMLRLLAALPLLACAPSFGQQAADRKRPNVLFLAIDDLRTALGCYGDTTAISPNIDAIAARGMVFERAYVQQAVCAASRASLLTGCRPDTTGVDYPYTPEFISEFTKSHATIPTWFDRHGYYARLGGKIHHQAVNKIEQLSGEPLAGKPGTYLDYAKEENAERVRNDQRGDPYEMADVDDFAYRDGFLAREAMQAIKDYAAGDQAKPLFLGVGFIKPHLPFNAPKKYWDLYDRDKIPPTPSPDRPLGAEAFAQATYELPTYHGNFGSAENPVTDDLARTLRHAYYACVSYVDALVGRVMAALADAGLADNTLICLWGDHGFHLGDNGMWGKHVNYEVATHAPLIFAGPGVPKNTRTDALVEFVDIYPTLCELAEVPKPDWLEGKSLRPLMADPQAEWDDAAFSQYPRKDMEGYACRTDDWRYVEWRDKSKPAWPVVARELYDVKHDPYEKVNVADKRPAVVEALSETLMAQFHFAKE